MKKYMSIIPLVLLLCFVVGCQDKAAMAELEQFKARAALEEQNKDVVKKMFEAWDNGNFEAVRELLSPDFKFYSPAITKEPRSLEEHIEFGKSLQLGFPDNRWIIEELISEGNKTAVRYIFRGTQLGEFQGMPATGNIQELSGMGFYTVENGKIIEAKEEFDELNAMLFLGYELKPKEAGK